MSGPGLNAGIHKPQLSDEKRFLSEALADIRVLPEEFLPVLGSKAPPRVGSIQVIKVNHTGLR